MPARQLTMLSNHACTEDLDSWNFSILEAGIERERAMQSWTREEFTGSGLNCHTWV